MELRINVNRSGRVSADGALPSSATAVEIRADSGAPSLDYDVYLTTPQNVGYRLITVEEYLSGNSATPVIAMLCRRDASDSVNIMSVRFVANVMGISRPHDTEAVSGQSMVTICMTPLLRPGQIGEYRSVVDINRLWNVRSVPTIPIDANIIFRPSFDILDLYLDGSRQLYSYYEYSDESGFIMTIKESPTSEPIKRVKLFNLVAAEGVYSFENVGIQQDGISLTPFPCGVDYGNLKLFYQMWLPAGFRYLNAEQTQLEPIWLGLSSAVSSVVAKVAIVPQTAAAASAPAIKDTLALAALIGEVDPSFAG